MQSLTVISEIYVYCIYEVFLKYIFQQVLWFVTVMPSDLLVKRENYVNKGKTLGSLVKSIVKAFKNIE